MSTTILFYNISQPPQKKLKYLSTPNLSKAEQEGRNVYGDPSKEDG